MDHHIQEDSAGNGDILRCRRIGVTRADAYELDISDLSCQGGLSEGLEIVVEAAVESYLEAELLGRCCKCFLDIPDFCGTEVDRLLAEDVLAGIDGFN